VPTWRIEYPLLLGVDVGTSRTKAVLVDADGRESGVSTAPTPFATRDGRVEMTVDELHVCLAAVVAGVGDARRRVAAVGLAGMAESGAPLDRAGRALAPVIAWHDERGQEAVEVLERHFGPDLALRIGQPVRTVLTAAKLGWLVDHGLQDAVRWLGVPELGLHALTGAEATEFSLAARTGCYDVAAGGWMPEVGDVLGFSTGLFPPILPAGAVMGRVSAAGAAWSGVPAGIPVTVAGHDHLAGMAGAGVRRGAVANSVGTAETLVARTATLPDMATALDRRAAVTVHPGGEEWVVLVSAARAGLVLDAAAESLGRPPDELDRLAEHAAPVSAADVLDGAALPAGAPGQVWAGLLEALAERTAEAFGRLTDVLGARREVVVFGGGSVSGPWLRAKAARLSVPVLRSTVASAVARGAAVQAGVAAGWWASADEAPTPEAAPVVGR
jgi:xylulokinase